MPALKHHPQPTIVDIRTDKAGLDLKHEVQSLFCPAGAADGRPRRLPTLLLYDEEGLQLFERITYLDEYYLTGHEMDVLRRCAADVAAQVPAGAVVMELGSGNLRKVCLLLQAFEALGKPIDYYALDLSRPELERTLAQVPAFTHVRCHGLLGTYDDGCEWLRRPALARGPKCVLHLGSSIGNFARDEAAQFLRGFAAVLGPRDCMIVGIDSCDDPGMIYRAYNDEQGLTHQFTLNGLAHANRIFGREEFRLEDWKAEGEYVYDNQGGRHQAFVSAIRDTTALGAVIKQGQRVQIEQSIKYSKIGCDNLWRAAGLRRSATWNGQQNYGLHMLRPAATLPFSLRPAEYASSPLPSMRDWEAQWDVWDMVTRSMLPEQELEEKPIKLRNACIFYLGHIPTFLDIQLTKTTGHTATDPACFHAIFERGIDPDVEDPSKCHEHSETPSEWPPLDDILAYQDRVRARLRALYAQGGPDRIPRAVGRAVFIAFEHELMHVETLLYMMLQSDKTLPPPHGPCPDFAALSEKRKAEAAAAADNSVSSNPWHRVPEQTITLGMEDPEDGTDPCLFYGWDNEKPSRQVTVHAFEAKERAITNEEYAQFLFSTASTRLPASWAVDAGPTAGNSSYHHDEGLDGVNGIANGIGGGAVIPAAFLRGKAVRTVYGLVPLEHTLDWPIFASYNELADCAAWMGGRIPTMEEARSIYEYVDRQEQKVGTQSKLAKRFPAVNGHLVNDGVEETPPPDAPPPSADGSRSNSSLFVDLTGANVGFSNWHPVAATSSAHRLAGQSRLGGLWEWTSTPLQAHTGFEPMPLYPGYTADFFGGKHNVVLGGSWATHPRIAGRKSFVNWYQRNYSYAWVGARLVRDL